MDIKSLFWELKFEELKYALILLAIVVMIYIIAYVVMWLYHKFWW